MKKSIITLSLAAATAPNIAVAQTDQTEAFSNWHASFILDALYFNNSANEYPEMEGFPMGGHNHGPDKGLRLGHAEAMLEGDLNQALKTRFNLGISHSDDEGLEFEWEEVYLQTKGLDNGLKFTFGRQFTELGYHTAKHNHEWDFADQPLIIDAIYGAHPTFDGIRMNWVAPTEQFLELGAEIANGNAFPASGGKTASLFAKTGGDFNESSSWLLGAGVYRANNVKDRVSEGHEHEGEEGEETQFNGKADIWNINATYKWAPQGNFKAQNLTLQAEYFEKNEKGDWLLVEDAETFDYKGKHSGFYAQAVYQWQPNWRVGYRVEKLTPKNSLFEDGAEVGEEEYEHAGLHSDHSPTKQSLMIDYSPRHESRVRLQYNQDKRSESVTDHQWVLQYTHSFGAHGAHAY